MNRQVLSLLISAISLAFVPKEAIQLQTLPNGLRVIVLPREELDLVSLQIWLRVGSIRDGAKPGLLHLLEHMLFNGSSKYPPGAVDEKIEEMGGKISAETGQDFTYFSIEVRPEFLPQAMDILSDLLLHPLFEEEELEREKKIVIAEIKGASNPFQECAWEVARLMFKEHPYRNPIPGSEETVNGITKEDLLSAWQSFYIPSLASLIVVGKVKSEEVFELARQFFQDWKGMASSLIPIPHEPPLEEVRKASYFFHPYSFPKGNKEVRSYIALGFPAPCVEDKKGIVAMDLLNQMIEDGKLFKQLKETALVSEIRSFFLAQRYPSIFIIYASTWSDVIEKVRQAILDEISRLKNTLSEGTLSKAKKSLLFSYFRNCETYSQQAHILGFYESIADFSFACDYPQMVQEITLDEVRGEWERFIRGDACCFVSLTPQK